jgi:hypothetical protein
MSPVGRGGHNRKSVSLAGLLKGLEGWGWGSVAEHLPGMCKVPPKKKRKLFTRPIKKTKA